MKRKYTKQVIGIAKQYGFTDEAGDVLSGLVERYAKQGKAEMEMGIQCDARCEIAILLMALKEEEERFVGERCVN